MMVTLIILVILMLIETVSGSPMTKMSQAAFRSPIPTLQIDNTMYVNAMNGKQVSAASFLQPLTKNKLLLVYLTHLGDLGSWELAQKLTYYIPKLQKENVKLVAIAPGSLENAKVFAENCKFPAENLYMDLSGESYRRLGFSQGAFPNVKVSPYLKLLPMLAGIESKGTIPEVLRGYFGDKSASPDWIKDSLRLVDQSKFDIEGTNYQRPFELATLRLQNMIDVLKLWKDLIPEDLNLITQQGAMYAFKDKNIVYEFKDTGILAYGNVEKALSALGVKV